MKTFSKVSENVLVLGKLLVGVTVQFYFRLVCLSGILTEERLRKSEKAMKGSGAGEDFVKERPGSLHCRRFCRCMETMGRRRREILIG